MTAEEAGKIRLAFSKNKVSLQSAEGEEMSQDRQDPVSAVSLVVLVAFGLAGELGPRRAGAQETQLWKTRPLAAGECPLPARIAQADVVVLGRAVAVEKKSVEARPFPGSGHKVAYRVLGVKVEEVLRGDMAHKGIQVGFIPPESYERGKSGVPTPPVPFAQTLAYEVGQQGLFFLKKHHEESFYVSFAFRGGFLPGDSAKLGKKLEDARKLAKILKEPVTALKADNAANRYLASAMLIRSLRPPAVKGQKRQQEPIDAAVSKLLLKALAEADWKYDAYSLSYYPPHPDRLFQQLGVSKADGYDPPAADDIRDTFAATEKWLRDNQEKYAVKRIVVKAK